MSVITALTMPKWGLAMTEGKVAEWLVAEGDSVTAGAEVLEIETSKITNVLEAEGGGVLRRVLAEPGVTLPVGALLGVIAEGSVPNEEVQAFVDAYEIPEIEEEEGGGPEPELIDVGGAAWRILRMGEGDGVPILFLHGFGGDLNNWLFNQPAAAEFAPTVAVDLPGHGGSAKSMPATDVPGLAAALFEVMDAAELPRAHLVGHSLGGAIALRMALDRPDRVASAMLIASAGLGPEINRDYIDGFVGAGRRKQLKSVLQALFADPGLVTRDLVDDLLKFKRLDGVTACLQSLADGAFAGGRQAEQLRGRIDQAACPVMVVFGNEDAIIPPSHAEGLPASVAVTRVAGKGHMVHMEAAGEVNALIKQHMG